MLIARSTPAQKPRGLANRICILLLQCRIDLQHFDIKMNGTPGKRMVEIDGDRIAVDFSDHARHFAAVHSGKEHNRPDFWFTRIHKLTAREILDQVRAWHAKCRIRLQRKRFFLALFQTQKLLLKAFRQGGVTQTKQRRFAVVAGGFGRGAVIQLQREMNENRAVALYGFRHANCSLVLGHLLPGGATLTGPAGATNSVGRDRYASPGWFCYACSFAAGLGKKPSSTINAAPTHIALSARLKVAKCQSPT